jgi:hypothetical protein
VQQASDKATVSPPQQCDWNAIDWRQATLYVRKLRQAIFRAKPMSVA